MVRAGYVEFEEVKDTRVGVPQGAIVSPILSNLILNELDQYIERVRRENESETAGVGNTMRNPEYRKIDDRINKIMKTERRLKAKGQVIDSTRREERLKLIKHRAKLPSSLPRPGHNRLYYVRYADDWLIGIAGSSKFAKKLKADIARFLKDELKLELSLEKTLITNASREKAMFLGTEIHRTSDRKGEIKRFKNKKGHSQRIPTTASVMNAPIQRLVRKFQDRKLVT